MALSFARQLVLALALMCNVVVGQNPMCCVPVNDGEGSPAIYEIDNAPVGSPCSGPGACMWGGNDEFMCEIAPDYMTEAFCLNNNDGGIWCGESNCGPEPTSAPFPAPTSAPFPAPTSAPIPSPTSAPFPAPTSAPFPAPTSAPIPAPTSAPTFLPPGATGAICFTGDSLLTLKDGSTKPFHELQVGDNIQGADRNGTISFSQVIFNPHPFNNITKQFDEIVTINGKVVRMTRNHLLPLCNGGLVTARSVQPGDCVRTVDGEEKVAKTTKNVEASGIYTAVTENEFLVVDGVVASPFALAHGIAHSVFNREDVNKWCEENSHLVPAAKDAEIMDMTSRRRLTEGGATSGCVELMETLFENYKDEGVGWGTNGFGYKNFKTIRAAEGEPSLPMRLSGFA